MSEFFYFNLTKYKLKFIEIRWLIYYSVLMMIVYNSENLENLYDFCHLVGEYEYIWFASVAAP